MGAEYDSALHNANYRRNLVHWLLHRGKDGLMKKSEYVPAMMLICTIAERQQLTPDERRTLNRIKNWLREREVTTLSPQQVVSKLSSHTNAKKWEQRKVLGRGLSI